MSNRRRLPKQNHWRELAAMMRESDQSAPEPPPSPARDQFLAAVAEGAALAKTVVRGLEVSGVPVLAADLLDEDDATVVLGQALRLVFGLQDHLTGHCGHVRVSRPSPVIGWAAGARLSCGPCFRDDAAIVPGCCTLCDRETRAGTAVSVVPCGPVVLLAVCCAACRARLEPAAGLVSQPCCDWPASVLRFGEAAPDAAHAADCPVPGFCLMLAEES